jgi:hypothetical protein
MMKMVMMMKSNMKTQLQPLPFLIGSTSDGRITIYDTVRNETINVNDILFGYHSKKIDRN